MKPTTAAGRALLADPASGGVPGKTWQDGWRQTILAIEAEAREQERRATVERIRLAVSNQWVNFGEEWTTEGTEPGTRVPLIRAANLDAILDAEAER